MNAVTYEWSEKIAGANFRLIQKPEGLKLQRRSYDKACFGGYRDNEVYVNSRLANEWIEIYELDFSTLWASS